MSKRSERIRALFQTFLQKLGEKEKLNPILAAFLKAMLDGIVTKTETSPEWAHGMIKYLHDNTGTLLKEWDQDGDQEQ